MPQRPTVYRPRTNTAPRADTRPTAAQRGYDHHWQQARLSYLADHPLCVRCQAVGLIREATVVDHVIPHRGDQALFWDQGNWMSLCKRCHDRKTATEDRR